MAFCTKCGKGIVSGSQFCSGCGQAVVGQSAPQPQQAYQQPQPQQTYQQPPSLLQQLSSKIKTNSIIWIVIACLQFAIGLFYIVVGFVVYDNYENGLSYIIGGAFVILVGVLNITSASKDFKYSSDVFVNPVGIVARFQPLGNLIGTLIYNLLFGGIIGVVGSIYAFVLRNFVLTNTTQFQAIEVDFRNYSAQQMQN